MSVKTKLTTVRVVGFLWGGALSSIVRAWLSRTQHGWDLVYNVCGFGIYVIVGLWGLIR